MVEQETITHGIRMSKRVELVLVTRQETIILPIIEPTMAQRCTCGYQNKV
jgi:hypothetical protein